MLVDPQIDARQRELFHIDFDLLDVPRDRFLVAGDAWQLCRQGKADPKAFGVLDMYGLWFIASNVIRDVSALNNHEMLPWDVWGAMTQNDAELDLAFIDRLAGLTRSPDEHFGELRALYETDERLRVPATVFNAVLNRPEAVRPGTTNTMTNQILLPLLPERAKLGLLQRRNPCPLSRSTTGIFSART